MSWTPGNLEVIIKITGPNQNPLNLEDKTAPPCLELRFDPSTSDPIVTEKRMRRAALEVTKILGHYRVTDGCMVCVEPQYYDQFQKAAAALQEEVRGQEQRLNDRLHRGLLSWYFSDDSGYSGYLKGLLIGIPIGVFAIKLLHNLPPLQNPPIILDILIYLVGGAAGGVIGCTLGDIFGGRFRLLRRDNPYSGPPLTDLKYQITNLSRRLQPLPSTY